MLPLVVSGRLRGTVVSVHRAAANVRCADRVVTLGLAELGMLPNGVSVVGTDDLRGVAVPGEDIVLDVSSARPWSPVLRPFAAMPTPATVARGARAAAAMAPAGGFGPLLRSLDEDDDDLFRAAAAPALRGLRSAVQRKDRRSAEAVARTLVGLGSGLTPSGDDVLVGFTAALVSARSPLARPIARACADSGARTTLVARMYLEHAAHGEYAERVHDLIAAASMGDVRGLERAASWGATSGADLMLGVFVGAQSAWSTRESRAA